MKNIQTYIKENVKLEYPSIQTFENTTLGLDQYSKLFKKMLKDKDSKIAVFPDYDFDGIISGTILVKGLKILGVSNERIKLIYPNREVGYGLSEKYLERMQDCKYIMTTDNGIDAFSMLKEINYLDKHIYLISDHHTQTQDVYDEIKELNNFALVDPNAIDDETPFKDISGSTVIWKLLVSIFASKKARLECDISNKQLKKLIDLKYLLGLTVISDVMPIVNENNTLLKYTMDSMNAEKRDFHWSALASVLFNDKNYKFNYDDIGWNIAPLMNADSRVNLSPENAFKFWLSDDVLEIYSLAKLLFENNLKRKDIVKDISAKLDFNKDILVNIPIVNDPIHTRPFAGLIASKLVEKNRSPIIAVADDGEKMQGSARSFNNFDLIENFSKDEILLKLDFALHGHPGAAGVNFPSKNFEQIKVRLNEIWDKFKSKYNISSSYNKNNYFDGKNVQLDQIKDIENNGPYGNGRERPKFYLSNIDLSQGIMIGKDNKTLKLKYNDFDILCWNYHDKFGSIINFFDFNVKYDLVGQFKINVWKGKENLQFIIDDIVKV